MAAGVGAAGVNYDVFGSGGGSDLSGLIQAQGMTAAASQPLEGFFIPGSSSSFMGAGSSMVSFKDACGGGKRNERQFMRAYDYWDENADDEFDDYFQQPDPKKRRLTAEQVRFLEKSFEVENKLEPERKVQLAKELGLQPRQVAIWFQNRRARWKNKQLEKDFETLQTSFDRLKADYDHLLREKDRLKAEVVYLSDKLQVKEKLEGAGGAGESETSDSENQLQQASSQEEPVVYYTASSEEGSPRAASSLMVRFSPRPEDLPSMPELDYRAGFEAKSPTPYADRCQLMAGLLLSSDPTAYGFEQPRDCSDVSHDNLNSAAQENLLPCSSYNNDNNNGFVASVDYGDHDATANSPQFGIPGTGQEGDNSPWIWSY